MSKPPLPEAAVTMLAMANPAVITTLQPDGQPVSTATIIACGSKYPAGS
jgi:hypothetical protein